MTGKIFAGLALALSLAAPAFSKPSTYEVGALQVEQQGRKGPAVILIPGLASGTWVWTETAQRLRRDHVVYLLTLPGFDGRAPIAGTTLSTLASDIRTLIESKHLDHPVLVGHSLGGTLSLDFATDHSDLVAGVIAVDGLPVFPGTEAMPADRKPLGERMRAQFSGQTPEQFTAAQVGYMKQIGVIDPVLAEKLAEHSSRSDISATADFAGQVMELDLRPRLAGIGVPVVEISPFNAPDFAAMGVDEAAKTGYYHALLAGVQQLDVISIAPSRHFVMFDQPQKFAAALDAALARMFESAR